MTRPDDYIYFISLYQAMSLSLALPEIKENENVDSRESCNDMIMEVLVRTDVNALYVFRLTSYIGE